MEYIYFVITCTILFFIILRLYKYKVLSDKKLKQKNSNLVFLLTIPILLYITKYMYMNKFESNIITPIDIEPSPLIFNDNFNDNISILSSI